MPYCGGQTKLKLLSSKEYEDLVAPWLHRIVLAIIKF